MATIPRRAEDRIKKSKGDMYCLRKNMESWIIKGE